MAFYWKNTPFGDRLKYFLEKNKMSRSELAEKLGVSVSTISLWLSNKREPKEKHRIELCTIFDVSYLELMHTSEELAYGNLFFLFKKHGLNRDNFERFEKLEEEISDKFIDVVGKYRKIS